MNKELLNQIQRLIIDHATKSGISLADQFNSVDDFKQFVIGFTIRSLIEICKIEIEAAYDIVMGNGAFRELSDSIWKQLNADTESDQTAFDLRAGLTS